MYRAALYSGKKYIKFGTEMINLLHNNTSGAVSHYSGTNHTAVTLL